MRLETREIKALQYALKNFQGEVMIFGSRLNDNQKGGDIDLLLIPEKPLNRLKTKLDIQRRFMESANQSLDIVMFDSSPFVKEIMTYAQRIDIQNME